MLGGNRQDDFFNTLIKRAFIGGGNVLGAAANLTNCQLWNPAASGVIGIIRQAHIGIEATGDITLKYHTAALADDSGLVEINKYIGEAAPNLMVKWLQQGEGAGTFISYYRVSSVEKNRIIWDNPIIIPEGYGVHFCTVTTDINLLVTWEWTEVPV